MLPPLWLLIGIAGLGPIVLNGVMPATTAIMRELSTTYSVAQLVLTVFLAATMFSQIVLGNWADRYGRRPIMIGSLLVFALGGLICALSTTIEILLLGRFVQGTGAAVCTFLPRTIVSDVYPRNRAASMIGYMTTAMMVAPMFGPALGGWITDVSSWRLMYAGLSGLGLLFAALAWAYQNETLAQIDVRPVGSRFTDGARVLLSSKLFRAYLYLQVGCVGGYYCFLSGAPYILMELRGYTASTYGLWFMMVAVGYLTGNLVAGKLSERLGVDRMIGYSLIPGTAAVLLFWLLSGWSHPVSLFLPMQLLAFSNGVCLPNLMSATMNVRRDLAGSASGLAGTVQTAFGILLTLSLGVLLDQSAVPMYLLITLSTTLALYGFVQKNRSAAVAEAHE